MWEEMSMEKVDENVEGFDVVGVALRKLRNENRDNGV